MIEEKQIKFERHGIAIEGTVYLIPGTPYYGYNCGYSIFVPKNCDKNTTLLLHSCNTGGNVPIHLDEANDIAKRSTYERPNLGMCFGAVLNMPVMIPLIPRIQGYYTQSLRRMPFLNDVSDLISENKKRIPEDQLSMDEIYQIQEQCRDIPTQVVNMIESAKGFLQNMGINIDNKIITEGYSAGAQFANYFTALHPELVKACIAGGNSGLSIIPLKEYNNQELKYPLGVSDIENFNYDEFIKIPQLYYIGTEDYNDAAMVECEYKRDNNGDYVIEHGNRIPITDEYGNIIPVLDRNGKMQPRYKESYNQEEIEIIHTLFGTNPQNRFDMQEQIYKELGVNAIFKRFPGDHITVNLNHEGNYYYIEECIKDFIKDILNKEKKIKR